MRLVLALTALLAGAAQAQQLAFTPYHAGGIYDVGERVGWTVEAAAGQSAPAGSFSYIVKRDGGTEIGRGTFDLAAGRATIETSLDQPGMVFVEVRPPAGMTDFMGASKSEKGRALLGAAVAPARIGPSASRPSDFDDFWAAQLRRLDSIPLDPVLTPAASGRAGVDYFTIRMANINGGHVYGQLARPSRAGRFPAMLIFQWASAPYPLQKQWVTDWAAEGWLVLNVEPHDVPSDMPQAFYDALPTQIRNYRLIGMRNRNENYFLPMYLGDYRAAEYLAGRPDWNGTTMVVTGTSMGGMQSFAVAGLNRRITDLVVYVPAGCDLLGPLQGRMATYPNWDVAQSDIRASAPYFDAANFAPSIRARSLVAMGFIDETATPAGIWATYNLLAGPKEAVPLVTSPHNHMATAEETLPWTRRSGEWLRAIRTGTAPPAAEH